MSRLDRFRAPQVDSETFEILEKMLQTVESFGFEFWVFGFEMWGFGFEILGVWHAKLGVWHAKLGVWHTKLGVWLRCWGNPHLV